MSPAMPTETRKRARHERERGRRERGPASEPGEIPGQTSIVDALNEGQDQEEPDDGQA